MPTSSQAMILRSNDIEAPRTSVSSRSIAPAVCHPIFDPLSPARASFQFSKGSPKGSPNESMEVVKFDVTLSANPQSISMNGFEGTFSFDAEKKAYKWQIFSVGSPKSDGDVPQNSPLTLETVDTNKVVPEKISKTSSTMAPYPTPITSKEELPSNENIFESDSSTESSIHEEIEKPALQKVRSSSLTPEIDERLYQRLEELGFRRRRGYAHYAPPKTKKVERRSAPVEHVLAEKPSPPDQLMKPKVIKMPMPLEIAASPHPAPVAITPGIAPYTKRPSPKKRQRRGISLLQEIKDKVKWDKRILPSSRVQLNTDIRKWSACFNVPRDADFSHAAIKRMVESQTGCKISCLQFDPVTVRTSDPEAQDRWIVTFADKHDLIFSVQRGLNIQGTRVDVNSWDDVVAQERQSYKEYQNWFGATRLKVAPEKHPVIKQFLDTNLHVGTCRS